MTIEIRSNPLSSRVDWCEKEKELPKNGKAIADNTYTTSVAIQYYTFIVKSEDGKEASHYLVMRPWC